MAEVYDRWHLSRPPKVAEGEPAPQPCEHVAGGKPLYPSAEHGAPKRWQVRWRDHARRQRKENFAKRSQAQTRADTVAADLARGLYVDPAAGKESFRAVAERWRTAAVHREQTADRVRRGLENHIYPVFGDRPIMSIRASEIQAWIKDRSTVLAPSTLAIVYSYMASVFRTAEKDRLIGANPCKDLKAPKNPKTKVVPLEPAAVLALADAVPEWYRAAILLAAGSGARQGEVFGLEVEHVDFLRREMTLRQQVISPDRGDPYIGELKTPESYRTVPLAPAVVEALSAHLARFPARPVELEDRTDPRRVVRRQAWLVFTNERREAIRRAAWSRVWAVAVRNANRALAESGVEVGGRPVQIPAGTTMHDLRHFYASLLIKHRESVKTVQVRLGHRTPSITLDTYTHLWPEAEDTTRDAVQGILAGVPEKCPPAAQN